MTSDFHGSYNPDDVTFLVRPMAIASTPVDQKEALIQSGKRHYSEMLSAESLPDARYLALFEAALQRNKARLARDVAVLAAILDKAHPQGRPVIIASLLRAGTPIGILLRRALMRLGRDTAHYSLSIIRDRGIDHNALAHIAARHDPADAFFVDGWTGKGAIAGELLATLSVNRHGFQPRLSVVADPAGVAQFAATHDDYLIPSGLLNAIISGLVSRSVRNDALVGPDDFDACAFYTDWAPHDLSRHFVDEVDAHAITAADAAILALDDPATIRKASLAAVEAVKQATGTADINRIKPGIAEATRALLRRVPDRLFLRDADHPDTAHLVHLAGQHNIAIETLSADCPYMAIAVIKSLGSE